MRLSDYDLPALPRLIAAFSDGLGRADPVARVGQHVLARVTAAAASLTPETPPLSLDPRHHAQAIDLLEIFGMGAVDRAPSAGLSWDGASVSVGMEPSVIIHEVAHYQVAAPDRRHLIDFGLGAGPETGDKDRANADQRVGGVAAEVEEALASLLGVIWEAALGQPAILAFLEQNWLEGGASIANLEHYRKIVGHLLAHGLIDAAGQPTLRVRECHDDVFIAPLLVP